MKDKILYYHIASRIPTIYKSGNVYFVNSTIIKLYQSALKRLGYVAFDIGRFKDNGNLEYRVSIKISQEDDKYYTEIFNGGIYTNRQRTYM